MSRAADSITGIKLSEIIRGGYRLVGWGTGSVFDFYDEFYPLPLSYLIDNDSNRQGERKAGLEILGPDVLAGEDPAKTAIIIYSSFWPEIEKQISRLGPFLVIPVTKLHNFEWQRKLDKLYRFSESSNILRSPSSDNAIVVQGPVMPDETRSVLRFYAAAYPNDWIILSTWENTDDKLLSEVRPFVDECILNRPPEKSGTKNRNYQIVSTRSGLEVASKLKCRFALKIRTDMFVAARNLIYNSRNSIEQWDSVAASRYGLEGRILIPMSFTRRYLLYHPSDLFMAGYVGDLLTFWQADLDDRIFDLEEACRQLSLKALSMGGMVTECYLGQSFARRIGWKLKGDLLDSWQYYRDLFLVVDNRWADLCWLKNPSLITDLAWKRPQELVDHYFWQSLYLSKSRFTSSINDLDISVQKWHG